MKKLAIFILLLFVSTGYSMHNKITYGYVEKVELVEKKLMLYAKLDTGAKSASLNAIHIQEVIQNDKPYLRFIVPSKQGDVEFIAEYLGKVRIKVRAGEIKTHSVQPLQRPMVLLKMRIGNIERDILVNLTNRKRFNYPLLLGRDAINAFSGLVDPSMAFNISSQHAQLKSKKHEF